MSRPYNRYNQRASKPVIKIEGTYKGATGTFEFGGGGGGADENKNTTETTTNNNSGSPSETVNYLDSLKGFGGFAIVTALVVGFLVLGMKR